MLKNSKTPDVIKYQDLFFDLDHTLWDFESNAKDSMQEIYKVFHLQSKAIDSFDQFYQTYYGHNAILWSRYEKGYITSEELKWRRMWRTLLDFKIADEKLAKDMSVHYLEILPTRNKVFDYTFEILQYLKEKGYHLSLLTNGFKETQMRKLTSSHLTNFFEHVITSESSNSMKPEKEIFDFALKETGGRREESIMIGDNPEADMGGALNAGMDSIFVNRTGNTIQCDCTFTIHHLKELENIL